MSEVSKKKSAQDLAIHEYLQSLLSEVPNDEKMVPPVEAVSNITVEKKPHSKTQSEISKPVVEPQEKPVVVGLDQLVAEVPEVISQTLTEVVSETQPDIVTQVQAQPAEKALPSAVQTHIPEWAETRFQCLLFNVSGLSLAVPLVKLNSVIPWDENITATPNQTDWYLGLVQHLQNQIKVIDTALLVMPENRRVNLENDAENRLSHILLVDDYKWGLACSSIGDVIWLSQDEVKWRKNKTSRTWLSGTSLEHLCAIMDTEVFAQMLIGSS